MNRIGNHDIYVYLADPHFRMYVCVFVVVTNLGVSDESVTQLFEAFDTDSNGLVDTLEWLVAIALVSGMDVVDKVQFVFSLYDFEKTGLLGRDAVCLLLRSAVKGLAKMCPSQVLVSTRLCRLKATLRALSPRWRTPRRSAGSTLVSLKTSKSPARSRLGSS